MTNPECLPEASDTDYQKAILAGIEDDDDTDSDNERILRVLGKKASVSTLVDIGNAISDK